MHDCYYGDASTVETSVFINAEILDRLFFLAITKSFALHRGAETPFNWTRIFFFFFFFFLEGVQHRRCRLSPLSLPLYSLIPPPFTLSPSPFLYFFLLPPLSPLSIPPAPCTPSYTFKATKRRGAGARDKVGVRVGKGEGEGRERRGRVKKERESKKGPP